MLKVRGPGRGLWNASIFLYFLALTMMCCLTQAQTRAVQSSIKTFINVSQNKTLFFITSFSSGTCYSNIKLMNTWYVSNVKSHLPNWQQVYSYVSKKKKIIIELLRQNNILLTSTKELLRQNNGVSQAIKAAFWHF